MTLVQINKLRLDSLRKDAEYEVMISKHKIRSETLNAGISMITAMNGVFIMSMLSGLYAEEPK